MDKSNQVHPPLDTADAVLRLCERGRLEAELLQRYHLEKMATVVEGWMERFEAVALQSATRWVSLTDVQRVKGWSDSWLRDRARELEPKGLARKRGGQWQFRRDAVRRIPVSPRMERAEIDSADPEEISDLLVGLQ